MPSVQSKFDMRGWIAGLDRLKGPFAESLARRIAVSGARVLRDEAKVRAPVSDGPYNPESRGSHAPGTLRDSLFVAKNEKLTTNTSFVYSVSWPKKAWWGQLVEFGYYMPFAVSFGNGFFFTHVPSDLKAADSTRPGRKLTGTQVGKHFMAKPFLGPAYDAKLPAARDAMIARGVEEFPKLLKEQGGVSDGL